MTNYNERLDKALERLAVAGRGCGVSEDAQIAYKFVVYTYQYDKTGYFLKNVLGQEVTLYARNNQEAKDKAISIRDEPKYRADYVWGAKILRCEEVLTK